METKKKWTDKTPRQMVKATLSRQKHPKKHTVTQRNEERKKKKKRIRIKTGTIKEEYSQANKQTYK